MSTEFFIHLPSNWHTVHLPVTTSTMLRLRENDLASRTEEFVLLTTDYQTAGRGQRGTSWESDAGKNLTFGFLFHPCSIPADRQFSLSEALALAVAEALDEYVGGVSVKWPNDVYWHDKKICGMLLEHDLRGSNIATTLTGVGVNVNQREFRGDAPNPVSLFQITGSETDRATLLRKILLRFESHYRSLLRGEYAALHSLYIYRLFHGRGFHRFRDAEGEFEAEVCGISSVGHISLRKKDGTVREYAFKEVLTLRE